MARPARPITNLEEFNKAIQTANLDEIEIQIIDYVRFMGTFSQPILVKDLKLEAKPPALSRISEACRKIGQQMPEHFEKIREWSKKISLDNVRWDGNLICCTSFNFEGERLVPEAKTAQFHNFVVHKELFNGLD